MEIKIPFNKTHEINALFFFSSIFLILYLIQIILYYFILKKYKKNSLFLLIIFSPALILFNFYDINTYYVKDIFVNLTILIHCFYLIKFQKNFNLDKYKKFIFFVILPLLVLNILNHELQFFFIGVHLLLTIYIFEKKKIFNKKILYSYSIILLPILILVLNPGSWEKLDIINNSIRSFDATANNQLAGNLNLAIGGFIKWHFFYQDIDNFINFFLCFILSIFLFFVVFNYLIEKDILKLNYKIKKYYLLFFLPSLALFILALDYGRIINLILTHLLAFYLILEIDHTRLKHSIKNLIDGYFIKYFIILFLIFYFFMWYLPQGAGYNGIGQFNDGSSIIKNTLSNELVKIFMIFYDFIDQKIITLPRVIV